MREEEASNSVIKREGGGIERPGEGEDMECGGIFMSKKGGDWIDEPNHPGNHLIWLGTS